MIKKINTTTLLFLIISNCGTSKPVDKAPDFTLRDINGEEFNLYENIGKVIIINFWDTWCPPCRAEIPSFIDLYSKYKDKGVLIIGIALAMKGEKIVKSFVEEYKINYPVLIASKKVIEDYGGITGIPTTFILNKKGEIAQKLVGYRNKEFFEEKINELLK